MYKAIAASCDSVVFTFQVNGLARIGWTDQADTVFYGQMDSVFYRKNRKRAACHMGKGFIQAREYP